MGLYAPIGERVPRDELQPTRCRMFVSVCCGALLGSVLSFVVNCALVEISLNAFFAFYMGVIFFIVGGGVIARVLMYGEKAPRRRLIIFFGMLVLVSGVLCIFFDHHWMFTLSEAQRVPLYTLLGMSLSFAVAFAMVDLINFATSESNPGMPSLIESTYQIHLVLGVSIVMGIGYGLVFGLVGVGHDVLGHTTTTSHESPVQMLGRELGDEILFCVPFGLVLGGLGAAANEWVRATYLSASDYKYDVLDEDDSIMI